MKNNIEKKYIYLGIIGALCFGFGDWLLGYVDTTMVSGTAFAYIRVGHGVDYNTNRAIAAMAIGTLGLFFYYPALVHMADIVNEEKKKKRLQFLFGASAFVWLLIHYYYSINVFCYAWMMQNGGEVLAGKFSKALGDAMLCGVAIGYIPLIIPNVLHLVAVIKSKTVLKKTTAIFHPLVWIVIFNIGANMMPSTPFTYGLYTFCMNAGMLVWFIFMLFYSQRE